MGAAPAFSPLRTVVKPAKNKATLTLADYEPHHEYPTPCTYHSTDWPDGL